MAGVTGAVDFVVAGAVDFVVAEVAEVVDVVVAGAVDVVVAGAVDAVATGTSSSGNSSWRAREPWFLRLRLRFSSDCTWIRHCCVKFARFFFTTAKAAL